MRRIRVKCCDYWPGYNPESDEVLKALRQSYEVEFSEDPEYLFFSAFGLEHLKYDCVKVYVTGENIIPDFNLCDYAIGFDDLRFGDRNFRLPSWVWYSCCESIGSGGPALTDEELLNRGFCSFVVSNGQGADPIRQLFYEELSKYKPVASGGRFMNNVGGPVPDKLKFCSAYKFNIAFENARAPGYVTEKLMQGFAANSLPVYYGADEADLDFNPSAFVRVRDMSDVKRAVEEVVMLDQDDGAYLGKVRQPRLIRPPSYYREGLNGFLRNIVEQPLPAAKRMIPFGSQGNYLRKYTLMSRISRSLDAMNNRQHVS